jgi:hypothetical protein
MFGTGALGAGVAACVGATLAHRRHTSEQWLGHSG